MSKPGPTLPLVLSLGLLTAGSCAGGAAAAAPGAGPVRCAAISAGSERLACYDAAGCAGMTAADHRLACYDGLADRPSSPPPTVPATASRSQTANDDAASFGLDKPQAPAAAPGLQKIDARVVSVSADSQGHVTLTLDNGQTWAVNDSAPRLQSGDTVTIQHAALGSYLLKTASRHSYRVQRLR